MMKEWLVMTWYVLDFKLNLYKGSGFSTIQKLKQQTNKGK